MEKEILRAFLYKHKLRFSEIERFIGERSNKLAYHLNKLTKKDLLRKKGEYYALNENFEHTIPYISDEKSVLPVILISIKNGDKNNEIFLVERKKRPFKELLGLPGGRILLTESIKNATERIMKEKFNIKCQLKKVNSVSLEHVKKSESREIVHSFLLILVTATTNQNLNYTSFEKNKSRIISSDYKLIKNNLDREYKIEELKTKC